MVNGWDSLQRICIHVTLMVENSDSGNHTTFKYLLSRKYWKKHTKFPISLFTRYWENHTSFEWIPMVFLFTRLLKNHTSFEWIPMVFLFTRLLKNHTSFEYTDDLVTRLLENPHKFQMPRVFFLTRNSTQILNTKGFFLKHDYLKIHTSFK